MTLAEGLAPLRKLRDECVRLRGLGQPVTLVLPWVAREGRVRLFKKSGPYGEVISKFESGRSVAYFDPKQVLEAIDAELAKVNQ